MAKEKHVFYCKECGYESAKWMGQCPGCRQWNTFVEEKVTVSKNKEKLVPLQDRPKPISMDQVSSEEEDRIETNITELSDAEKNHDEYIKAYTAKKKKGKKNNLSPEDEQAKQKKKEKISKYLDLVN